MRSAALVGALLAAPVAGAALMTSNAAGGATVIAGAGSASPGSLGVSAAVPVVTSVAPRSPFLARGAGPRELLAVSFDDANASLRAPRLGRAVVVPVGAGELALGADPTAEQNFSNPTVLLELIEADPEAR